MGDVESLKALLRTLRANGVTRYRAEGLEIDLSPESAPEPSPADAKRSAAEHAAWLEEQQFASAE